MGSPHLKKKFFVAKTKRITKIVDILLSEKEKDANRN